MSTREKMLFSKAIAAASLLIAIFGIISASPHPGVIRERHIIHAPIKFKIIHHYNIKKVPLLIKKHLHYYKPQEELHHHSKPTLDETHDNQIYQADSNQYVYPPLSYPQAKEEDYEEAEQSQEENENENDEYEDYDEYE